MKILLYSPAFYPMIGGLENVVEALATEFTHRGHQVCVMCKSEDDEVRQFPFRVVRRPRAIELIQLTRWCDVVLHANVNLKALFPFAFARRPWVVTHQGTYYNGGTAEVLNSFLKCSVSRFATNITCSHSTSASLGLPCTVIPNPYDDSIFKEIPGVLRERDLIFVGRLVSDKGADMAVDAVARLRSCGVNANLTITGTGPEEPALRKQSHDLDVDDLVRFTGPLRGDELAREMNAHRIMVVPSKWREPFGIVALEGIACGCLVVGSDGGGLKDAIGPCGLTFPNENGKAFFETLRMVLANTFDARTIHAARASHTASHTRSAIGGAYLAVMEGEDANTKKHRR